MSTSETIASFGVDLTVNLEKLQVSMGQAESVVSEARKRIKKTIKDDAPIHLTEFDDDGPLAMPEFNKKIPDLEKSAARAEKIRQDEIENTRQAMQELADIEKKSPAMGGDDGQGGQGGGGGGHGGGGKWSLPGHNGLLVNGLRIGAGIAVANIGLQTMKGFVDEISGKWGSMENTIRELPFGIGTIIGSVTDLQRAFAGTVNAADKLKQMTSDRSQQNDELTAMRMKNNEAALFMNPIAQKRLATENTRNTARKAIGSELTDALLERQGLQRTYAADALDERIFPSWNKLRGLVLRKKTDVSGEALGKSNEKIASLRAMQLEVDRSAGIANTQQAFDLANQGHGSATYAPENVIAAQDMYKEMQKQTVILGGIHSEAKKAVN